MAGLEFLRAYLDDLLIISNSTYEDHPHQLEIVLQRLKRAGLKVHAEKSSFFAPEIEYLGYMLTKEGIKQVRKKSSSSTGSPTSNYPEATQKLLRNGTILQRHVEKKKSYTSSINRFGGS